MLFVTFGTSIYYGSTITAKDIDKLYKEFQRSTLKLKVNNKYKGMYNGFHRVTWRELTFKNVLWEIAEHTYIEIKWDLCGSKKL